MSEQFVVLMFIIATTLIVDVVIRCVVSLRTLRFASHKIAYVPGAHIVFGLGGGVFAGGSYWSEFIRICQKAPVAQIIPSISMGGHCDTIRSSDGGKSVEVELVGSGKVYIMRNITEQRVFQIIAGGEWGADDIRRFEHDCNVVVSGDEIVGGIIVVITDESSSVMEMTCARFSSSVRSNPIIELTQIVSTDIRFPGESTSAIVRVQSIFMGGHEECMVCYERRRNTIIIPCRHCSVCTMCLRELREPRCVVCRQYYQTYLFIPPNRV